MAEFRPASSAGQVQQLKLAWTAEHPPKPGDVLMSRNGQGGWHLTSARPRGDSEGWLLAGKRFDGPAPVVLGATIWPYSATGGPAAPSLPVSALPCEIGNVRPLRLLSDDEINARSKLAVTQRVADAEALPRKSSPAEWADPDSPTNQRVPKTVRGRKRCDEIGRLARTPGSAITALHIQSCNVVKTSFDIAKIGMSSGSRLETNTGSGSGRPSTGPGAAALKTLQYQQEIAKLFDHLGPAASVMLQFCVLENKPFTQWCAMQTDVNGNPANRQVEMGRLLGLLDRLTEFTDEAVTGRVQHRSGGTLQQNGVRQA